MKLLRFAPLLALSAMLCTSPSLASPVPHLAQLPSESIRIFLDPVIPLTVSLRPLQAVPGVLSRTMKLAPSANGTVNYPQGAVNTIDAWGSTGPVVLKTASLAGLVANTPVNVIAATTGKQIVVVGYSVSSNVAGSTVVFQDETAVTPLVYDGCTFAANDHIQVYRGGMPLIITAASAALDIAITGSSDVVKGSITYYLQ